MIRDYHIIFYITYEEEFLAHSYNHINTRLIDGLKYGSEEKDSSLCRCSILLGFIMSKHVLIKIVFQIPKNFVVSECGYWIGLVLYTVYDKFNSGVPGQNGIWVKF